MQMHIKRYTCAMNSPMILGTSLSQRSSFFSSTAKSSLFPLLCSDMDWPVAMITIMSDRPCTRNGVAPFLCCRAGSIQLISLNWNPVNRDFRKWVGCEALAPIQDNGLL